MLPRGMTNKADERYLIHLQAARVSLPPEPRVEIVRSFSYKLNVGNYESRDFFCSQKIECPLSQAEEVSRRLYDFCREQVRKAIAQYKHEEAERQHSAERNLAEFKRQGGVRYGAATQDR